MTTTMQPQIVTEATADATAHEIVVLQSAIRETQRRLYELRAAFTAYMVAENASTWSDGKRKATLTKGKPVYSVDGVRAALGEIVEPETMAKLIVENEQCT